VVIYCSSRREFHLLHFPSLLLRQLSEKIYLVFAGWFPVVVGLECALQVSFDVHIKCLWFQLRIRRVVNSRLSPGASQVMKVASQLVELCSSRLLLQLGFFQSGPPSIVL